MNDRTRILARVLVVAGIFVILFLLYPPMFAFAELAAREMRYLWWLILLAALGLWMIFGLKKR